MIPLPSLWHIPFCSSFVNNEVFLCHFFLFPASARRREDFAKAAFCKIGSAGSTSDCTLDATIEPAAEIC